jgi:cell fate (sporulation/competence/biofilm development) regulator YlbF (YheA/YmcA/DUF963 family)
MIGENMQKASKRDTEFIDPAAAKQSARNFAAALVQTDEYKALKAADAVLEKDRQAEAALNAYNAKVRSLQAVVNERQITKEEEAELGELRMLYMHNPAVIEYAKAQAELREICQQAGDILTKEIGLDFGASACGGGCCG